MKKYKFVAMMALLVSCLCLSACANGGKKASEDSKTSEAVSKETGKLKIVTTIFPVYDWVKELLGDRADQAEITLLLKDQADLHSYQPSAEDILKISDCDLFIHVGGESDKWVADTLKQGKNPDRKVINLLDQLGSSVKEEELVEGMEAEPEHEEGEKEEEGPEYDEHVWLSLKNAGILCGVVANTLKEIDPEYAEHYQKRADAYIGRLDKLDRRRRQMRRPKKHWCLGIDSHSGIWRMTMDLLIMRHLPDARRRQRQVLKQLHFWQIRWISFS